MQNLVAMWLKELIRRQNLAVLNANDLCKMIITRHRTTVLGEEKSVIDYIIVCDFLLSYLEKMLVDENRMFVLTKEAKPKLIIICYMQGLQ